MTPRTYIAIDLKSFFASVECIERGLDPLTANLVVADASRTNKTICLAITPSLKAYGISGRPRLFEVESKINQLNANREEKIEYIIAMPRMKYYIEYSTRIYNVYLKYFSKEDIHIYSIDEVFIDITRYSQVYKMSPYELVTQIISDVVNTTGITATAGIGENIYLAKVAMDIMAKKMLADKNGTRIATLDMMTYRKELWSHRPITDFWRVGKGIANKLACNEIYTMGDIARCSLGGEKDFYNEDLLYRLFGVNAELLIDHAWGVEPCTMEHIKKYKPQSRSINSGQVLHTPYEYGKAIVIIKEMTESIALELVTKNIMTDQLVLRLDYERLDNQRCEYRGVVVRDSYGREVPKHSQGTVNIGRHTSSTKLLIDNNLELYDQIANKGLLIRKITISANHIIREDEVKKEVFTQMNFFTDFGLDNEETKKKESEKEKKLQEAMISIKNRYGRNAILKGTNLLDEATMRDRNNQIGGHKA